VKKHIKTSYNIHVWKIDLLLFFALIKVFIKTPGRRNRYFYFRISQSCWRRKSSYRRVRRFIVEYT